VPLYTNRLFQIVVQKAGWVKGNTVDKKTLQGALKKLQASDAEHLEPHFLVSHVVSLFLTRIALSK
jgi:hypothetical protein